MSRYAAIYFFIFVALGAYVPWMPPWLVERGLTEGQVAGALAAVAVMRALLPAAWGWLADRVGGSHRLFPLASVLAAGVLCLLMLPLPVPLVVAVLGLYGMFWVPLVPFAETLTLSALGDQPHRYGEVRWWGSLGFVVATLGVGFVFERWSAALALVPLLVAGPYFVTGILGLGLPRGTPRGAGTQEATEARLPWRPILALALVAALGQSTHGPYYAFFSLRLKDLGVGPTTISALWVLGVLAEILVMTRSAQWIPKLGLSRALRWALALTALRWTIFASTDNLIVISLVQLLHAASFGLMHLTVVQWVDRLSPPGRRAVGQGLLSSVTYGLGVGGGLALSGAAVGVLGHHGLFAAGAVTAGIGWVLSFGLSPAPQAASIDPPIHDPPSAPGR